MKRFRPKLPDYYIIPFEEHYDEIMAELEFFGENGIDHGILFDETLGIIFNNTGMQPTEGEFDDMDYMWVSVAYDTYARNVGVEDQDLEAFHSVYGQMIEKIFLCIYCDVEYIIDTHAITNAFYLEFESFVGKDLVIKAGLYNHAFP